MFRPGPLFHAICLCCVTFEAVVPRAVFLAVLVGLVSLGGCANQGVTSSVEGKSLSGHLQLKQKQIAYSDSYITDRPRALSGLGAAAEGQFHTPQFIEKGKLNVGNGSLSYGGHEYSLRINTFQNDLPELGEIELFAVWRESRVLATYHQTAGVPRRGSDFTLARLTARFVKPVGHRFQSLFFWDSPQYSLPESV